MLKLPPLTLSTGEKRKCSGFSCERSCAFPTARLGIQGSPNLQCPCQGFINKDFSPGSQSCCWQGSWGHGSEPSHSQFLLHPLPAHQSSAAAGSRKCLLGFCSVLPCPNTVCWISEILAFIVFFRGCHKHQEWVQLEVGRKEKIKNQHFKLSLNPCPAGSKERSCILPVLREQNGKFCSRGAREGLIAAICEHHIHRNRQQSKNTEKEQAGLHTRGAKGSRNKDQKQKVQK